MTQRLTIKAQDRNGLYLFALNLPEESAKAVAEDPEAPAKLLGISDLDLQFAEVIRLADLGEMSLAGYLAEGYDVEPEALAVHRARLVALDGYALIALSSAFGEGERIIEIGADLTFLARLDVAAPDWSEDRSLVAESARPGSGEAGHRPPSDAAMMGRVATVVLVLLFALTGLMVWIAG